MTRYPGLNSQSAACPLRARSAPDGVSGHSELGHLVSGLGWPAPERVAEGANTRKARSRTLWAIDNRGQAVLETLRKWVRQAEIDDGKKPGTSTAESAELRELRRKNRELEQTIAILTEATRFFAREADPLRR
jgi:transposase